ncbi:MAG TPA: TM2 domain-containing protein [Pyrinomonadaceae bacterium]|nr:TM2 domain-containing protein [Pyrinomonadaceae bacterium]
MSADLIGFDLFTIMAVFCTKCGTQNEDFAQHCSQCYATLPLIGTRAANQPTDYAPPYEPTYQPIQPPGAMYAQPPVQDWQRAGADKKIIAGILGIVVGGLGIHKFILGYQKEGMIMLLVSLLSCGTLSPFMHVIGIVEGIMYLTKTDEDFVRTYVTGRKGWF